jgi:hypothetical protein
MVGAYLLGLGVSIVALRIDLPVLSMVGIISLLVLVNGWTWWRAHGGAIIGDGEFFGQLNIDILGLAASPTPKRATRITAWGWDYSSPMPRYTASVAKSIC